MPGLSTCSQHFPQFSPLPGAAKTCGAWGKRLITETQQALATVLPLDDLETEFLDHLLEEGDIQADLLTSDPEIQAAIEQSPGLRWKGTNVREYKQRNVD